MKDKRRSDTTNVGSWYIRKSQSHPAEKAAWLTQFPVLGMRAGEYGGKLGRELSFVPIVLCVAYCS